MEHQAYQTFRPAATLRPFVATYWMYDGSSTQELEELHTKHIPNAMAEMVIHLEDRATMDVGNSRARPAAAVLKGLYTRPYEARLSKRLKSFGILFKPEGLVRLFDLPLNEFQNGYHDLTAVKNKSVEELICQIQAATTITQRIEITDAFLLRKLKETTFKHEYLASATQMIRERSDSLEVEQLSKQLFVSRRTLERHFKTYFGVSPKTFHRIERLNRAINLARNPASNMSWTSISYACGYSDQAHLIKDFREFADEVPSSLLGMTSPMHNAYNRTVACS